MSLIERKVMPPIFRARSAISPVIVNLFSLFVEEQVVVLTPHRPRALVTFFSVRPTAVAIYGRKSHKHLCEEKSVDVEKPESSWGTTGEQLLART
jgi:hypothetical protein